MKRLSKQITLGYDPVTGNRIRKRIYADSAAGLRQAEKDLNTAYAKHGAPSAITYKQYLDKWWIAYCGTLSPHTQYCYKSVLKNMDTMNYVRMSKITRTDLQAILNDLWDRPNLCRKLCGLMHQIFRSAAFDGVIEKDISQGLKRPKLPKTSRRAFTKAELDAIKKVVLPERDRFLVDLLLQFGLRPAEALALNVHDFDRKARTLTISKAVSYKDERTAFIKSTKTGVTRVLPVPDSFWNKIPKISGLYYFSAPNGHLLSRGGALDLFNRILAAINRQMGGTDKLKATDITMYSFRHNKASQLMYITSVSTHKKAEYLGHSVQMFLQTYSHIIEANEDTEALRKSVI